MIRSKPTYKILPILLIISSACDANPERKQMFSIGHNGTKLEHSVSLSKDTFFLLEPIVAEIKVKNTSTKTTHFNNNKPMWWTVKDEKGETFRQPLFSISPGIHVLKPNDSLDSQVVLKRWSYDNNGMPVDVFFPSPHFPPGKYKVYYGATNNPLIFYVKINPDSQKHFRIQKFYEFNETHQPGKHLLDMSMCVPTSLYSSTLSKGLSKKDYVEEAYEFFEMNKELYGITEPRTELRVYRAEKSELGPFVVFKQLYKGVEIWRSDIRAFFSRARKLYNIQGYLLPDINISPTPRIDKKFAILKALRDLKLPSNYKSREMKNRGNEEPTTTLLVLPFEGKYFLTWLVGIYIDKSDYGWEYFIDANTGRIVRKAHTVQRYH